MHFFSKKLRRYLGMSLIGVALSASAGGHIQSNKHAISVFRQGSRVFVTGLTSDQAIRFEDVLLHEPSFTSALGSPVVSIGAPNAFGPTSASVFISGAYVNHWANSLDDDGLFNLGVSFGNPHKFIGVLISSTFSSLGINQSSFGQNGFASMRLNHYFTPNTAIAFGMGVLGGWGAASNVSNTFYGALTQSFQVGALSMAINLGIGTGGLNRLTDVNIAKDDNYSGFVGYAVSIFKGVSLIVDYATEEINFGGTYTYLFGHRMPFFVSIAGKNLSEHNGSRAYLQVTTGLSFIV